LRAGRYWKISIGKELQGFRGILASEALPFIEYKIEQNEGSK
jgi:hypothetical protein